jgi:hypothetical protein
VSGFRSPGRAATALPEGCAPPQAALLNSLIEIYSANTRTVHNARLSEIERGGCVLDRISEVVVLAGALQIAPSELMSCRCRHWPTGTPTVL